MCKYRAVLFIIDLTPFPKIFVYHASLPYENYSCPSELDLQNMTAKDQRIIGKCCLFLLLILWIIPGSAQALLLFCSLMTVESTALKLLKSNRRKMPMKRKAATLRCFPHTRTVRLLFFILSI